jgi:Fe-S cluster assembly iron-binding protein IscA
MNLRVSFGAGGCPGLSKAKELSFVTPGKENHDFYDSILLDDGLRCYFDKVTWISP